VKLIIGTGITLIVLLMSWIQEPRDLVDLKAKDKVSEVLHKLGDKQVAHIKRFPSNKDIELGKRLFHDGFSLSRNGRRAKRLSKHFVCSSCHNVEKEFKVATENDPQKRLQYALYNDLPFLQGSTMYGAINRTTYYNGDYFKKYGDLVYPARKDLKEAVQLCAIECAQGRRLKNWEMDAILAYIWTLGYTIEDLNLTKPEFIKINNAINDKEMAPEAIALLKTKYLDHSPATFVKPPSDYEAGYELTGDPDNGMNIYELSCLHCHEKGRYSFFELDKSKDSYKYLHNKFDQYSHASVYQVGRYGTPPKPGKKAYMPQYTAEKMSNQQMEDLRAYLREASK
jgi:mono/diheme cytochrome c family protein